MAEKEGKSVSEFSAEVLSNKVQYIERVKFYVGSEQFYPIHLSKEELRKIVTMIKGDEELPYGDQLIVKVRKTDGGKGVEFMLDFLSESAGKLIKMKRWTAKINLNWSYREFTDHWISAPISGGNVEERTGSFQGESISVDSSGNGKIQEIINDRIKRDEAPVRNPIFDTYDWNTIYMYQYFF